LTFVRHGESQANADGVIDTRVPGPDLTAIGRQQALDVDDALTANGTAYDGIYVSNMIRTRQTADPFVAATGLPVDVLPGLREINAGIYEGAPQDSGLQRILYAFPAIAWTLGLRFVPILGSTDYNGSEFEARTDTAIQTIYDSGDINPVAFSHGLTISTWTVMNVTNPDPLLILTHPLGNTAVVVVTGNPTDGWTLRSWDGIAVDPNPALPTKLFVDFRNLVVAPQTAIFNVRRALATGDPARIADAVREGIVDVTTAAVTFPVAVTRDVVDAVRGASPDQVTPVAPAVRAADTTIKADETVDDALRPHATTSPTKPWRRATEPPEKPSETAKSATEAAGEPAATHRAERKEGVRDNVSARPRGTHRGDRHTATGSDREAA
jgi:broad specificity phosphatase PhoE